MSSLLKGIVKGCRQSGCALLGGETAEMPGVYQQGEYDVAGFCVGMVDRPHLVDGSKVHAGDVIVGLASSGVHANGFSLIRKLCTTTQLHQLKRQLLAPTRIYVKPVLRALRQLSIHAIAHITGGGISRRIPSLVDGRRGLSAQLVSGSWKIPSVFQAIQRAGAISNQEMLATFNMGIGMALVCAPSESKRLLQLMHTAGVEAWTIGRIERN